MFMARTDYAFNTNMSTIVPNSNFILLCFCRCLLSLTLDIDTVRLKLGVGNGVDRIRSGMNDLSMLLAMLSIVT